MKTLNFRCNLRDGYSAQPYLLAVDEMNESALILGAFENRLRVGLV